MGNAIPRKKSNSDHDKVLQYKKLKIINKTISNRDLFGLLLCLNSEKVQYLNGNALVFYSAIFKTIRLN